MPSLWTVAKTVERLREDGYLCQNLDVIGPMNKRHDLFGIIDILAICDGHTLGVQTTTRANAQVHRNKMLREKIGFTSAWLADPNRRLELWLWTKEPRELSDGTLSKSQSQYSVVIEPIQLP